MCRPKSLVPAGNHIHWHLRDDFLQTVVLFYFLLTITSLLSLLGGRLGEQGCALAP